MFFLYYYYTFLFANSFGSKLCFKLWCYYVIYSLFFFIRPSEKIHLFPCRDSNRFVYEVQHSMQPMDCITYHNILKYIFKSISGSQGLVIMELWDTTWVLPWRYHYEMFSESVWLQANILLVNSSCLKNTLETIINHHHHQQQ